MKFVLFAPKERLFFESAHRDPDGSHSNVMSRERSDAQIFASKEEALEAKKTFNLAICSVYQLKESEDASA